MNGDESPDISVLIPMYNEEKNIDMLFQRLIPVLKSLNMSYEIVCVNDGSRDSTLQKLTLASIQYPEIKIINFARNFGKEAAMTASLDFSKGKCAVPIDSDLQDPPELIKQMVEKWKEGFDVVHAVRSTRQGETFFKKTTARIFYKFINFLSEVPVPPNVGDFRLMDRRVVNAVRTLGERNRFMKGIFAWVGFSQTSIYYDREPRYMGSTKWNYWKLWNFALDGILMFSSMPLKIWSYIGFFISTLAFTYAFFLITRTMILGIDVPGYASTIVTGLFLGGIQLIGLGVIGEYIARIYIESKGRPIYIVSEIYEKGAVKKNSFESDFRN